MQDGIEYYLAYVFVIWIALGIHREGPTESLTEFFNDMFEYVFGCAWSCLKICVSGLNTCLGVWFEYLRGVFVCVA